MQHHLRFPPKTWHKLNHSDSAQIVESCVCFSMNGKHGYCDLKKQTLTSGVPQGPIFRPPQINFFTWFLYVLLLQEKQDPLIFIILIRHFLSVKLWNSANLRYCVCYSEAEPEWSCRPRHCLTHLLFEGFHSTESIKYMRVGITPTHHLPKPTSPHWVQLQHSEATAKQIRQLICNNASMLVDWMVYKWILKNWSWSTRCISQPSQHHAEFMVL